MSMAALLYIRSVKATPTQKLILYALADMANDHGECWPSNRTLVSLTCLSERAVRDGIAALEASQSLAVERSEGRSHRFVLRLSSPAPFAPAPAVDAPPRREMPPMTPATGSITPAPFAPTPAADAPIILTNPKEDSKEGVADAPASSPPALLEASAPRAKPHPRACRIGDWHPGDIGWAYAQDQKLNPEKVWPAFQDYFLAAPGQKGIKQDWPAAWRGWCRRDAERHQSQIPPAQQRRKYSPADEAAIKKAWGDVTKNPGDL